jgi:hypothetical protein
MLIVKKEVMNDSRRDNGQDKDVSSDVSHPALFAPWAGLDITDFSRPKG